MPNLPFLPGFNGAAALTLRKQGPMAWGGAATSCFNGAAALTLRKLVPAGCVRARRMSFNGAAALTLRKPRETIPARKALR